MAEAFAAKVLFQKVSQILNLVRRIDAEAQATAPIVDFIVDRFDRNGIKGLGEYWNNRGAFSVINGVGAVAMAGAHATVQDFTTVGSIRTRYIPIIEDYYYAVNNEQTVAPLLSGGQLARYMARLSSDNLTITAKFTVPAATFDYVSGGTTYYAAAPVAFGIGASFDLGELGGVIFSCLASHVNLVGSSPIWDLTGIRSFISSDDGANIALNTTPSFQRDYDYTNQPNTSTQLLSIGENELKLIAQDDTLRVYLNSTLLFTDTTGAFTKGRLVGLMSLAACALHAGSIGVTPSAVTEFKAWVNDVAEPPGTESGHGVYGDSGLEYTDGYHDSEGAYDPLAFE